MKPQTISLKLIEAKDLTRFVELCHNFHLASPFNNTEFNKDKVINSAHAIMNGPKENAIILLLCDIDAVAQGFLIGVVSETPFGTERMAMELAWWVEPEYRGTRKSLELVLAYQDWAKRIGCSLIQMSRIENTGTDKLHDIYNKLGMRLAESGYIGEL